MRLQVIAATAAIAAMTTSSSNLCADPPRAAAFGSIYSSNDGVTVVSPRVDVRAPLHRDLDVLAGWEADVISAASVDVMTSASPRPYHEVRQGLTAGAVLRPADDTSISARWMPSWEPDDRSQTIAATITRDWIDRRLTTELGARGTFEDVGRHGAPTSTWRSLDTWSIDAGLAWIFSPRTVGQLLYSLQILDGYQASPYRLVRLDDLGVTENVPDFRVRNAFGVGVRQAMGGGFFASVSLRLYADSWSVVSHTEEVELQRALLDDTLLLGLDVRSYEQSAASFYAERYVREGTTLPEYRTADKMLTRSSSLLLGGRVAATLGRGRAIDRLQLVARCDLYLQRFFDFLPLSSRRAVVPALALIADF